MPNIPIDLGEHPDQRHGDTSAKIDSPNMAGDVGEIFGLPGTPGELGQSLINGQIYSKPISVMDVELGGVGSEFANSPLGAALGGALPYVGQALGALGELTGSTVPSEKVHKQKFHIKYKVAQDVQISPGMSTYVPGQTPPQGGAEAEAGGTASDSKLNTTSQFSHAKSVQHIPPAPIPASPPGGYGMMGSVSGLGPETTFDGTPVPAPAPRNTRLQYRQNNYIEIQSTPAVRIPFVWFPENITDSKRATYNTQPIMGRSAPVLGYDGSDSRRIQLDLLLFADGGVYSPKGMQTPADIQKAVRQLQSTVYPDYQTNRISPPPQVIVSVENQFKMLGVVEDINVTYERTMPWDINPSASNGLVFGVRVSMTIMEVCNIPLSYSDVQAGKADNGSGGSQ